MTMTKDEKGIIVNRLVPVPEYSGCWYDDSIVWEDERPFPTTEEIDQEYIKYTNEKDIIANNATALKDYLASTGAGYLHTDGNTYRCDKDGIIDMALAVILLDLDPYEPVICLTTTNVVVAMTAVEFKALASACGKYHYTLRQTYWSSLL